MRGQRSSTSIASKSSSTEAASTQCIETPNSQSIRPMPRASEQAERIMGKLSEVRDSMRKLSEQLKEVSETILPFYFLPTDLAHNLRPSSGSSGS